MKKRQDLYRKVLDVVFDFTEPFTVKELCKKLREENILTDKNEKETVNTIDAVFESPFIKSVPFTNQYYVTIKNI